MWCRGIPEDLHRRHLLKSIGNVLDYGPAVLLFVVDHLLRPGQTLHVQIIINHLYGYVRILIHFDLLLHWWLLGRETYFP